MFSTQVLLSLFYFLDFLPKPLKFPLGIYLLGDVGNFMADHILDGVFVYAIALGHRDKVGTAVMGAVLGVQLQFITDTLEGFLIPSIGQLKVLLVSVVGVCPVKQIRASDCLCFSIFFEYQILNTGMNGDNTILTGIRLHAALKCPVL